MEIKETPRGLSVELIMRLPRSLHARPSAKLAGVARQFKADVWLIGDNGEVNAKSMLDILSLAPGPNDRLTFLAKGEDAREALTAIGDFINNYKD